MNIVQPKKVHVQVPKKPKKVWFKQFRGVIRDIFNYRYIIKTVRRLKTEPEWYEFDMRHDWFFRIYTVLNFEPEQFMNPEAEKSFLIERIIPVGNYLRNANLHEILKDNAKKLEGEGVYAYLVWFSPLFYHLTFGYIFKRLLFWGFLVYAYLHLGLGEFLTSIYSSVVSFF